MPDKNMTCMLAIALVVVMIIIAVVVIGRVRSGTPGGFCGGGGPYNIQLYETPRIYPEYWGAAYHKALGSERCVINCGPAKNECTVWCR